MHLLLPEQYHRVRSPTITACLESGTFGWNLVLWTKTAGCRVEVETSNIVVMQPSELPQSPGWQCQSSSWADTHQVFQPPPAHTVLRRLELCHRNSWERIWEEGHWGQGHATRSWEGWPHQPPRPATHACHPATDAWKPRRASHCGPMDQHGPQSSTHMLSQCTCSSAARRLAGHWGMLSGSSRQALAHLMVKVIGLVGCWMCRVQQVEIHSLLTGVA